MPAIQTRTDLTVSPLRTFCGASTSSQPMADVVANASDMRFLDLLAAYRSAGGLATGHEIAARRPLHGLSELARAIASAEAIAVDWSGQRWLPFFQFESGDVAVRPPVRVLLGELAGVLDEWDLAQWFVQPNAALDGARPLHMLTADFERVHDAARALRFVCRN